MVVILGENDANWGPLTYHHQTARMLRMNDTIFTNVRSRRGDPGRQLAARWVRLIGLSCYSRSIGSREAHAAMHDGGFDSSLVCSVTQSPRLIGMKQPSYRSAIEVIELES